MSNGLSTRYVGLKRNANRWGVGGHVKGKLSDRAGESPMVESDAGL